MRDSSFQSGFRPARSAMSGWTLALLLATALASLPATGEGGRAGERAARALRTMQAEAYAIAGIELVAYSTLAEHQATAWAHPDAAHIYASPHRATSSLFEADVVAGLLNLPPPARA